MRSFTGPGNRVPRTSAFQQLDTSPCFSGRYVVQVLLSTYEEVVISSQVFGGLGFCKAPTVTTGVPPSGSTCPDATEGPENTKDSPRSLLSPISSTDSVPHPSLKPVDGLRNLRTLETDQPKIVRNVKGSVDTASASDSELRRSLRNHGTEENMVRTYGLNTFSTTCFRQFLSQEPQA